MSIADKLQRLIDTKEDIRVAIEGKGRDLTNKTFENDYATEIAAIETGGGTITGIELLNGTATESILEFDTVYSEDINAHINELITQPDFQPPNGALHTAFSPDDNYIAVGHFTSPFVTIYKRTGDVFNRLPNLVGIPAQAQGVAWSFDTTYLAVAHSTTPFVTIYKRENDTFTKLSNPDILPPNTSYGATFSPDGVHLVIGHDNSPFITIYKRDGDTFTKLPNPSILPTSRASRVKFSSSGDYLGLGSNTAPIYKRDGDTFTKLTAISPNPSNAVAVDFSTNEDYLVCVSISSPQFIFVYKRSGDTWSGLGPIQPLSSQGIDVTFSPDNNYIIATHNSLPHMTLYKRDGDDFNKITNPASRIGSAPRGPSFSSDGSYLSIGHASNIPGGNLRLSIFKQNPLADWAEFISLLYKANNQLVSFNVSANKMVQRFGYATQSGNTNDIIQFATIFQRVF